MKHKRVRKLAIIALLFSCIVGCTSNTSKKQEPEDWCKRKLICEKNKSCKDSKLLRYDNNKKTKHLKNMSMKQIEKEIENQSTFILYLGFDDCPWCVEAVPVLEDVADELGKNVYYTNIYKDGEDIRSEKNKDYQKFLEMFSDILGEDRTLYAPTVIAIREGEPIGINVGTLAEHNAKERKMTEEEVVLLKNIYTDLFKMIECKAKH